MQHNRKMRYTSAFLILGIATLVLVILNVCIGTVEIPFRDILTSIGGYSVENERILWDIRMPRTLAALLLGGALGLAGYLLQTFFHNPIAGPFVLGISSGAKMVVALVMVFLMGNAIRVSSAALIAAAFVGICTCRVAQGPSYGDACGQRRDDRVYLFGDHGTCRDVCKRCGYRQPSQLVKRKFFRNDM